MKGLVGLIVAVLGIFLAAVLQQALAPHLGFGPMKPDFFLVFLGVSCLFSNRRSGMLIGFFCGIVYGALAGVNLQHFAITRTVAGFVAAWTNDLSFQPSVLVAFLITASLTLFAQLMLMFLAAPGPIGPFLGDTIAGAVYNGVVAMPVYLLLKRFLDPPSL